jgi:NitT/TauT family transport system substrate-binding protein
MFGKEVLVGRVGGMPSLNFINGVKNEEKDISKININTSIDFASLSGAFIAGTGDFVNLFELKV